MNVRRLSLIAVLVAARFQKATGKTVKVI